MVQGKFPIGFWNYPPIERFGPEEVSRWTSCGMTRNMSPGFTYEKNNKEQMLAILDECQRQGMKLILRVEGLDYRDAENMENYEKTFRRALADFGSHPATYGFFIGDEPIGETQMKACVDAYRLQLTLAPKLTPFLNFNPYYEGYEDAILGGQNFTEWAKDFTKASGCSLVCYDCYTQLNPETDAGLDSYFLNLKKYAEMADSAGIELWTTLLSVGHYRYRVPTEDDLRWQLNTAAASGCRGILWFYFYNSMPSNNYRGAPIDELNEETETYYNMRRVQYRFHKMHGDLLYSLKHQKTYGFEKCYGTMDPFPQDSHPLIRRMISEDHLPGLLSFFTDEEGREYAVMVNNSPFTPGRFSFALDKKVKRIWRVELNGEKTSDFRKSHHDALYGEFYDYIQAGAYLAPGQMEIFRFE